MADRVFGRGGIGDVDARGPRAADAANAGPPERDPRLLRELQPGERVIWAGRPVRAPRAGARRIARAFGAFFVLFSLLWLGVLGAFVAGGWPQGAGISGVWGAAIIAVAGVVGLVPALIGTLVFISASPGRSAPDRYLYAITSERCVIWSPAGLRGTDVRSLRPEQMNALARVERGDGSGDLILVRRALDAADFSVRGRVSAAELDRSGASELGFFAVGEVAKVERLMRETYGIGTTGL